MLTIDTELPDYCPVRTIGKRTWSSATMATVLAHLASAFATALYASAADGDIIPVFVNPPAIGTLT